MNELTFLASWMPSELTGLFNKLALEYCSPPSPFAITEKSFLSAELDSTVKKYQTSLRLDLRKHVQSYRRTLQSVWKLRGCGGRGWYSNF